MGSLRRWWILWVFGLFFIAWVVLTRLAPVLVESLMAKITAWFTATGWVLFLAQYLYHKSERIFFATNRVWLWLSNKSVRWTLKVSLEETRKLVALDEIVAAIRESYGRKARVWQQEPNQAILNLPGWTIRIARGTRPEYGDIEARDEDFLLFEVTDLEIPFRESVDRIGHEIIPLAEKIVRMTDAARTKYAAIIGFKGSNPYFGFFVRHISMADVVNFQCEYFDLIAGERERVSVKKDGIELVSSSLGGIAHLSRKYLTLSPEVSGGRV